MPTFAHLSKDSKDKLADFIRAPLVALMREWNTFAKKYGVLADGIGGDRSDCYHISFYPINERLSIELLKAVIKTRNIVLNPDKYEPILENYGFYETALFNIGSFDSTLKSVLNIQDKTKVFIFTVGLIGKDNIGHEVLAFAMYEMDEWVIYFFDAQLPSINSEGVSQLRKVEDYFRVHPGYTAFDFTYRKDEQTVYLREAPQLKRRLSFGNAIRIKQPSTLVEILQKFNLKVINGKKVLLRRAQSLPLYKNSYSVPVEGLVEGFNSRTDFGGIAETGEWPRTKNEPHNDSPHNDSPHNSPNTQLYDPRNHLNDNFEVIEGDFFNDLDDLMVEFEEIAGKGKPQSKSGKKPPLKSGRESHSFVKHKEPYTASGGTKKNKKKTYRKSKLSKNCTTRRARSITS